MDINWSAVKVIWDVGQALVVVAFSFYVWWSNRNRASESTIHDINRRLDGVDGKIAQMEQTIARQPGHKDLEELRDEMAETNRLLAEINATQRATSNLVNRLHDYLLTERSK